MISTLTGDAGGAVGPLLGNISLLGADGIVVTGDPLLSSLTFAGPSFVTDVGTATPTPGVLNALGGSNINTAGAGDTLTINLDNIVTITGKLQANEIESTTSITAGTTVFALTFDTNLAAAAVTLSGTSLIADGTNADIPITITAKGTSQVIINDLQLTTDLAVSEGGTGVSSLTDHGVLVGSGAAALTPLAVGTDGQVLLGSTGADPVFATLTSTDGTITFTPGAGTLNIESVPERVWLEVTGTSQTMAIERGYILNNVALVTATLPATAILGSKFRVAGKGAGGWKIAQNAGQRIFYSSSVTTTGVAGSLASTDTHDCVELLCITANVDFQIISSLGNITVV